MHWQHLFAVAAQHCIPPLLVGQRRADAARVDAGDRNAIAAQALAQCLCQFSSFLMRLLCAKVAVDPNNPIVKLCVAGMQAESAGNHEEANQLFLQAWESRGDDFEACIAAHFVARHQTSPEETLRWNLLALTHAEAVGDERVAGFYPSLYLNLGWSYEQLTNIVAAKYYYAMADAQAKQLSGDRYGTIVRDAVARGQERIQT